jgi:uncharacterized integral membrane protein
MHKVDVVQLVGVLLILMFIVSLTPIWTPLTYLMYIWGYPLFMAGVVFGVLIVGILMVIAAALYKNKKQTKN